MTQTKNSSLIQLVEVFPSWAQEDLQAVLNEAGGDVYVAISRISEGHVSQWSDTKKTTINAPNFETRPTRNERNDRANRRENSSQYNRNENKSDNSRGQRSAREQIRSSAPIKASTPKSLPNPSVAEKELSWGDSIQTESSERVVASLTSGLVADRSVTAPKTSFAEAAASALAEKPRKEAPPAPAKLSIEEPVIETKTEDIEAPIADSAVAEVIVETVVESESIVSLNTETQIVESVASNIDPMVEEEEIVFMPARATPSLTMEQPAVVLPVRTNLRTNLAVRFGYDASEEVATANNTVEKVSVDEAQPTKTPITVSALESSFGMLSTSPAPVSKSPEPILSSTVGESSAWDTSRNSGFGAGVSASNTNNGYGNFPRGRQHGGWDYEPTNTATTASSNAAQGSFGPAPGFSGPTSPSAPQRFVSRAAAQYEHNSVYNSSTNPASNSRFSPYEETAAAGNNVSQYYTTRTVPQPTSGGYTGYRGGNSFNNSRYSTSSRPYYQQHHSAAAPHHQQAPVSQQQSSSASHYASYNPHQNYLNNYHHGYPQYGQHHEQYSHQQHQQQPQQPYYQPYQPPNQYLSNANMHHHSHNQNQHHNA